MSLYELSDDEAAIAFEAIQAKRIHRLCKCDFDTGFTCRRCTAIAAAIDSGNCDTEWPDLIDSNMAWHKGRQMMAERKRGEA